MTEDESMAESMNTHFIIEFALSMCSYVSLIIAMHLENLLFNDIVRNSFDNFLLLATASSRKLSVAAKIATSNTAVVKVLADQFNVSLSNLDLSPDNVENNSYDFCRDNDFREYVKGLLKKTQIPQGKVSRLDSQFENQVTDPLIIKDKTRNESSDDENPDEKHK